MFLLPTLLHFNFSFRRFGETEDSAHGTVADAVRGPGRYGAKIIEPNQYWVSISFLKPWSYRYMTSQCR